MYIPLGFDRSWGKQNCRQNIKLTICRLTSVLILMFTKSVRFLFAKLALSEGSNARGSDLISDVWLEALTHIVCIVKEKLPEAVT